MKKRDYAAEYRRRIERAIEKGISRTIARGHARKGEIGIKERRDLQKIATSYRKNASRSVRERLKKERDRLESRGVKAIEFADIIAKTGLYTNSEAYTLWMSP